MRTRIGVKCCGSYFRVFFLYIAFYIDKQNHYHLGMFLDYKYGASWVSVRASILDATRAVFRYTVCHLRSQQAEHSKKCMDSGECGFVAVPFSTSRHKHNFLKSIFLYNDRCFLFLFPFSHTLNFMALFPLFSSLIGTESD